MNKRDKQGLQINIGSMVIGLKKSSQTTALVVGETDKMLRVIVMKLHKETGSYIPKLLRNGSVDTMTIWPKDSIVIGDELPVDAFKQAWNRLD